MGIEETRAKAAQKKIENNTALLKAKEFMNGNVDFLGRGSEKVAAHTEFLEKGKIKLLDAKLQSLIAKKYQVSNTREHIAEK